MNIPKRITKQWLRRLSDEDLIVVIAILGEDTANYQSYSHARSLSDRWERAYNEQQLRKSTTNFIHPSKCLKTRWRNKASHTEATLFGFDYHREDYTIYIASDSGQVLRIGWSLFLATWERINVH